MGSVPKYSWIILSLIPTIFFQGIKGYLSLIVLGMFFSYLSYNFDAPYYYVYRFYLCKILKDHIFS